MWKKWYIFIGAESAKAIMTELQVNNQNRFKDIFDKYAKNGDGRISYGELRDILKSDKYDKDIPKHVVKTIQREADVNPDRVLNFSEFFKMIEKPKNDSFFTNLKKMYVQRYVTLFVPEDYKLDGAYEESYCCSSPPLIMILISLIQVVLHTIDHANGYNGEWWCSNGSIADVLIYDPTRRFEFWRFLSYMFVHNRWKHLFANIFAQLMLGIPLEMVHGGLIVSGVYLAGVIGGSLAISIINPSAMEAGAGGGVHSIISAYSLFIIVNWNEMSQPANQFVVLVWTLTFNISIELEKGEYIGHAAFYGFFIGFFIGIFILRPNAIGKELWVKNIAIVVFILLMGSAIIINIFYFPLQQYCANSPPGHSSWAFLNILCEILPRYPDGQYNFNS